MTAAKRRAPEDDLHISVAALLDAILMPPAEWTTFPAGNIKLPIAAAAKLKRMGLRRSWPDILVQCGAMHGIELKSEDGRLSKARMVRTVRGNPRFVEGQREVFPRLQTAGMKIAVCRSTDDVIAALRGWAIPLRVAA